MKPTAAYCPRSGRTVALRFFGRIRLSVTACFLLAILLPFRGLAQPDETGVEAQSQTICAGTSLTVHGQLFVWPFDVTAVSIQTAQGEPVDLDGTVSPQTTTDYILSYKKNGQDGMLTATATVTVQHPPFVRLSGNVAAGPVCPGTEITYQVDSAANLDGDVRWTLSTGEPTVSGDKITFIPNRSCTLFVNASNRYCGSIQEERFSFDLIPPLTFDHPDVTIDPPAYSTCAGCTFALPDWQNWSPRPSAGAIERAELTWGDGTTGEQPLTAGANDLRCNLNFTLVQADACDTVTAPVRLAFDLRVNGLDCEPVCRYETRLLPCEWTPVHLYAHADSTHVVSYANATLDIQPQWDYLEIKDSVTTLPVADGYALAQTWFLRAYDNPRGLDQPELAATFSADYTIACPYSPTRPAITRSLKKDGIILWENEWVGLSYQYCDRTEAFLNILAQQPALRIDTVWFEGVPADSFALQHREDGAIYYQTVHPIRTKTRPNFDRYKHLRIRIAVSRTLDDCHFADTVSLETELTESHSCYPYFYYDYDPCSNAAKHCVGAEHRLFYTAPLYYQQLDSLKIMRSGFATDATFNTEDPQQFICTFQPYFASEADEAAGRRYDSVVFLGFYHDTETFERFRDTFCWEIDLRHCPPLVHNRLNPDCSSGCMTCPGSELLTQVDFINPSTDPAKISVRWLKPPRGKPIADSLLTEPASAYRARWQNRYWLYEASDFEIEITYNEGKMLRKLAPASLPVSEFRIDPACAPRFELHRDSCCEGDHIYWHIYADFYKHFLDSAAWGPSPSDVEPVDAGREDFTYPSDPHPVRPRLTYRTDVRMPARYPYTVSYRVNDTVMTYSDTLRIAAVANPNIFLTDSLYVCSGTDVDLNPYIDRDVVAELIGIHKPNDLILRIDIDRTFPLTARMKYTCDHGDEISSDLHIFAEGNVHLSLDPTTAQVCPLDSLNLHDQRLSSNGRLHWMKRRWRDGAWQTAPDTIWKDARYNQTLFDRVDADSVQYTVVAFTACPDPPLTAGFKAVRLPKPEIGFTGLHACYPDILTPEVAISGEPPVDGTGQWFLQGEPAAPPYAPTYDTLALVFTVLGRNGCHGRGEADLYSYRPPSLLPAAPFCLHAGTEGALALGGADVYVWEGYGRPDPADGTGARYLLRTSHDTVVYATGTDLATGCVSRDTFDVRLYAPRLTRTTDTLCWLDDWRQPFAGDSLTRLDWYFGAKPEGTDGTAWVGRDSLRRWPLQMTDTGVYTRISRRAGCLDTQRYRLRIHPVPDRRLYGDDTLCEHERLRLFYVHDAQSVYGGRTGFAWFAPDGRPIATPAPADTVPLRLDSLRPADSGFYAMRLTYGDCRLLDSLHVTVFPIPYPRLPADTFLCETRYLILDAFNPDYPDGRYGWPDGLQPFPGAGSATGPAGDTAESGRPPASAVRLEQGGRYTATLTANGCTGQTDVHVEERPLPVLYLPADTLICRGEECVFYLPDHYDAYAWYAGDHLTSAIGTAPQQGFAGSGLIHAEVTHNGCADTAACNIERLFCGRLYFASAFTPNGNRLNDLFGPISVALPEDLYYELKIFDRNGRVVFQSTNPDESWDGTFRGRDCPAGVYTYQCRASVRRDGRDVSSAGRIVLIR